MLKDIEGGLATGNKQASHEVKSKETCLHSLTSQVEHRSRTGKLYSPGAKSGPLPVPVKFYWGVAIPISLCVIYSCFCHAVPESQSDYSRE